MGVRSSEPGKFAIWLTLGYDCNRSSANKLSIDGLLIRSVARTGRSSYTRVYSPFWLMPTQHTQRALWQRTVLLVRPLGVSFHCLVTKVSILFLSMHLRSSAKWSWSNRSGAWSTSMVVASYSADLLLRTAMTVLHYIPGPWSLLMLEMQCTIIWVIIGRHRCWRF